MTRTTLGAALAITFIATTFTPSVASAAGDVIVSPDHIDEAPLVPKQKLGNGDREFGGNGPHMTASARVFISPDKRQIKATIGFRARETKHDWSETQGEWTRTIFTAPAGKKIKQLLGAVDENGVAVRADACSGAAVHTCLISNVSFPGDKPAGFQIFGPTSDFKEFVRALAEIVTVACGLLDDENDREQCNDIKGDIAREVAAMRESENHVYIKDPDNKGPVRVFALVGDTGGDDISTDDNPKDDTRVNAVFFNKLRIRYE
jgi:hypothetical protein